MKEFMLLILNETDHQDSWTKNQHTEFLEKCRVYINDLQNEGKLKSAQPLVREGKIIYRAGTEWKEKPFDERKEVQVGYYHILAKDMEDAVETAKRNPEFEYGTTARIEIRPIKTKEESINFIYSPED
jgi:hypothetical protein